MTGAASGIGKAMALDFARRGMKVVAADIEEKALETARGEIAAMGTECIAVKTDVSRLPSVEELAEAAYRTYGAVHVLCNNAGVAIGGRGSGASQHHHARHRNNKDPVHESLL